MNLPLGDKRILLCNDDGIEAAGFELLIEIARKLSNDLWMVAPLQRSIRPVAFHDLAPAFADSPMGQAKIRRRRHADRLHHVGLATYYVRKETRSDSQRRESRA